MIYEYWLAGIEGISNLKKRKLRERCVVKIDIVA